MHLDAKTLGVSEALYVQRVCLKRHKAAQKSLQIYPSATLHTNNTLTP